MICPICKKEIEHGFVRAIAWEHTAGEGPRMLYAHNACIEKLPKEFHRNDLKIIGVRQRISDVIKSNTDGDTVL